jgi:hypothetical protein
MFAHATGPPRREQKPSAEHHGQQGPRHRRAHKQHEAHQARDPLSPKNIGGSRIRDAIIGITL